MNRQIGANMETVRRKNRASILKYINDFGPVSRKDISDATGLTPSAVTQICAELINHGILVEAGVNKESKSVGRKKVLLTIDFNYAYVFSINFDSELTTVALCNFRGEAIEQRKCVTDKELEPEIFLQKVADICRKIETANSAVQNQISAVGIGVPGIVDVDAGISRKAYGIWDEEVAVADFFSRQLSLPVYLENNVNALAVAERYFGLGKDYENLMLIKWGPGVGCAILIDQQVYEGRCNKAAEMGHFVVDPNGKKCFCGRRGCLETKISYQALQEISPFLNEDFGTIYQKNEEIKARLNQKMQIFASVIVNSATIVAPNRIVLTGPLFADKKIRNQVIAYCAKIDATWGEQRILHSSLYEREDYIGPVAICTKEILFS